MPAAVPGSNQRPPAWNWTGPGRELPGVRGVAAPAKRANEHVMREAHCLHHVISDAVGSVRARVRITGPEALGVRPGPWHVQACHVALSSEAVQRRLVVEVDPRIDTEIGDYRIEALLRTDDTGRVYLAEDVRLNRRVALRFLNPELAADERFRERFLRESRLVASLDHPSIVPVYERAQALPIPSLQLGPLGIGRPFLLRETPPALLSGDPGKTLPEVSLPAHPNCALRQKRRRA